MAYQTFEGRPGASKSGEKWQALKLPDLNGLRILDVGCNEGYFCNRAIENGAAHAVGVDANREVIEAARNRFPNIEFHAQSWEKLPDGPFDIILFLSAFHYAKDPQKLLNDLHDRLSPTGLLVLEIGMIPGRKNAVWEEVKRSTGSVKFPSYPMVEKLLGKFAFKLTGDSVKQSGDPCPRFVFHCRRKKPIVMLIAGQSGAGKTTLIRVVNANIDESTSDIHTVSIDEHLIDLVKNGPEKFRNAIDEKLIPEHLHIAFKKIRIEGLLNDFINILIDKVPKSGLIFLEGAYIQEIESLLVWRLQTKNFVVWLANRRY